MGNTAQVCIIYIYLRQKVQEWVHQGMLANKPWLQFAVAWSSTSCWRQHRHWSAQWWLSLWQPALFLSWRCHVPWTLCHQVLWPEKLSFDMWSWSVWLSITVSENYDFATYFPQFPTFLGLCHYFFYTLHLQFGAPTVPPPPPPHTHTHIKAIEEDKTYCSEKQI